jgi:hypothetical protein
MARIMKFFPVHSFETASKHRVKNCCIEAEERRDIKKDIDLLNFGCPLPIRQRHGLISSMFMFAFMYVCLGHDKVSYYD